MSRDSHFVALPHFLLVRILPGDRGDLNGHVLKFLEGTVTGTNGKPPR